MDRNAVPPSSPPGEDISSDLRRKIAVLKKALLKAREEKQKESEDLEKMKKKLSILELTISEKDTQLQISNNDRELLEKDLKKLKENLRSQNSSQADEAPKQSVGSLEQQNKNLLEEYQLIKAQNLELKTKFASLSRQHQEIQKQISLKDDHLRRVMSELEEKLEETMRQQENAEKDLETVKNVYTNSADSQNKLKNELTETLAKRKALEDEIISLNKELQVKQVQIGKLNERLMKQSENEATLSSKLMQYKNELVEAESYYQKHEVLKLNSLNNQNAVIVLKRDHTGEYVAEIEERKNKTTYPSSQIECISVHPHSDKRFFIRVAEAQTFEFESNEASTLVSKMNFFLTNARQATN